MVIICHALSANNLYSFVCYMRVTGDSYYAIKQDSFPSFFTKAYNYDYCESDSAFFYFSAVLL